MDMGSIIAICTTVVATIAGVATIISTIRYMKSENSKVLKEQAKILENIEKRQGNGFERQENILMKIEEGQQKGFERLAEIQERIGESQRKGFETLEQGQIVMAKILERIEGNTK